MEINKIEAQSDAFEKVKRQIETPNENNQNNQVTPTPPTRSTPTNNSNLDQFLPYLINPLPTSEFRSTPNGFVPPRPPVVSNSPSRLSRRIYLNMLQMLDTYSALSTRAPESDRSTIRALQNEMQILSITMLNINRQLSNGHNVPFRETTRRALPRDYVSALYVTYERLYNIYLQTARLLQIAPSNFSGQLNIILLNLNSQMNRINLLIEANS